MRPWTCVAVLIATVAAAPLALADSAALSPTPCSSQLTVTQLAKGLTIEHKRPSIVAAVAAIEPCLWIVRFDPERFSLDLHTGSMAAAKTAKEWVADEKLVGVINAAMYTPSGRPTGLTINDSRVVYSRDHRSYNAFFAFGPKRSGLPPAKLASRGCKGFNLETLKRDYRNVVQNYRLLDCQGKPLVWKDRKVYSVAAVAVDKRGYVAFVHMKAPYRMSDFNKILADPELAFVAAMYVEGGSPAQLSLSYGSTRVDRRGIGLNVFGETDKLPNILGFRPRARRRR